MIKKYFEKCILKCIFLFEPYACFFTQEAQEVLPPG